MDIKTISADLQMKEDEVAELLDLFITTTLRDMEKIREALKDNDFEKAASAAHSIKGAAANMTLDTISSLAKQAETDAGQCRLDSMEQILTELSRQLDTLSRLTKTGN
jgi:HPt (histidine-containing phosphotransfer) domain-containing protein